MAKKLFLVASTLKSYLKEINYGGNTVESGKNIKN
jgi:hypothetical protein